MKLLRSPGWDWIKRKKFGNTSPLHLEWQWKTSILAQIVLHSATSNGFLGLLWFWHDYVGSSEKSQTFSHIWGLDIPVSFYAVACLHAVFVILPPVSAFHPLNICVLRKEEIAPFPRVSIWPKPQCLGAKRRGLFITTSCSPQKNVIFSNGQCIVNKWSRHLYHHQLILGAKVVFIVHSTLVTPVNKWRGFWFLSEIKSLLSERHLCYSQKLHKQKDYPPSPAPNVQYSKVSGHSTPAWDSVWGLCFGQSWNIFRWLHREM